MSLPMSRLLRCLAPALLAAAPVAAQEVQECDWAASARNIAEPWEENTRTFSNGAVRVALLDTLEPAAAAFRLLILSPPYSELGDRQCQVVGLDGGGFTALDFAGLTTSYDPARGLTFVLPASVYDPQTGAGTPATLSVTLNQSSGAITPVLVR